jgi:hypothetical protein
VAIDADPNGSRLPAKRPANIIDPLEYVPPFKIYPGLLLGWIAWSRPTMRSPISITMFFDTRTCSGALPSGCVPAFER